MVCVFLHSGLSGLSRIKGSFRGIVGNAIGKAVEEPIWWWEGVRESTLWSLGA